jgi:hypothetical protein
MLVVSMHRLVVFAPRGHSYMVGTNMEIKCHVSTPFLVVLGEMLKMFSTLLYGLDGRLSSGGGMIRYLSHIGSPPCTNPAA